MDVIGFLAVVAIVAVVAYKFIPAVKAKVDALLGR